MNLCISCPYYGMSIWSESSSDSNRLGKSSLIFGLSGAYNCKSGKTSLIFSEFEQNRRISGIFREHFPKTSIRDHNQLLFREDFLKVYSAMIIGYFQGSYLHAPFMRTIKSRAVGPLSCAGSLLSFKSPHFKPLHCNNPPAYLPPSALQPQGLSRTYGHLLSAIITPSSP